VVDDQSGNNPEQPRVDRRHAITRDPGKRRKQKITFAVIGFFVLVLIGVGLAFYSTTFVFPSREVLIRVDDVEYSRGDMVKYMRSQKAQAELLGIPYKIGEEVFRALQDMVETEILVQAAPGLGITVTDEEVDNVLRGIFSSRLAGSEDDPKQLEREFQERYKQYLNEIQLSKSEDRKLVERSLLREKVRQHIGESVPTVTEQVHLFRLVMQPTDEIDIMQIKYEDFKDDPDVLAFATTTPAILAGAFMRVTREFSRDDSETVRRGGDLGWVPRGVYKEYDHTIFGLEPGKLSMPTPSIDDPDQIFFFMVSEVSDARELEPADLSTLKSNALQDWINDQRSEHEVYAVFNSDIYAWVIEQMRLTIKTTPTPAPASPFG